MAPSIDDLVNNAIIYYNGSRKHNSKVAQRFNKNGYNTYQGKVLIDYCLFLYQVRIGVDEVNNSIFYDVSLTYLEKIKRPNVMASSLNVELPSNKTSVLYNKNIPNENTDV